MDGIFNQAPAKKGSKKGGKKNGQKKQPAKLKRLEKYGVVKLTKKNKTKKEAYAQQRAEALRRALNEDDDDDIGSAIAETLKKQEQEQAASVKKDKKTKNKGAKKDLPNVDMDSSSSGNGGSSTNQKRKANEGAASTGKEEADKPVKKAKRGKKKKKMVEPPSIEACEKIENPYLEMYKEFKEACPKDMSRLFDPTLSDDRREELFDALPAEAVELYAWAIPDARALRAIASFGPVIEIGCGRGYWGSLLLQLGVDYVGYDIHTEHAMDHVRKGGPAVLKNQGGRSLMLCYPDDFQDSEESLAMTCLQKYSGDTIIHIGELFGSTVQDNPWYVACCSFYLFWLCALAVTVIMCK